MEHFSVLADHVSASDDNRTITRAGGKQFEYQSCYGSTIIPSKEPCKYIWKFKINKKAAFTMAFGISSSSKLNTNTCFFEESHPANNYAYVKSSLMIYKCNNGNYKDFGKDTDTINNGDTITMIFDLLLRALSFEVNDEDRGVVYCGDEIKIGINIYYRMAAFMEAEGDSVSLISFMSGNIVFGFIRRCQKELKLCNGIPSDIVTEVMKFCM